PTRLTGRSPRSQVPAAAASMIPEDMAAVCHGLPRLRPSRLGRLQVGGPPPRSRIVTTAGSTASRRERCLDPALPSVFLASYRGGGGGLGGVPVMLQRAGLLEGVAGCDFAGPPGAVTGRVVKPS